MTNPQPKPGPTTNERLMEVVAKLCPVAMARYVATGQWGDPDPPVKGAAKDAPRIFHPAIVAPYAIRHQGVLRLVQVSSEDGDVLGGLGLTTAEAVTRLRVKVGLEPKEESDA